jgi:hypothetical protein
MMSTVSAAQATSPVAANDCALSRRDQTRNLLIFAVNVSLIYLGAPVLYVGLTQAVLCERLGASKVVANLPSSAYFWLTPLPIVVAWYFSAVRMLKPVLFAGYLTTAVTGGLVVAALLLPQWTDIKRPAGWVIAAVLIHSAVLGCTLGVTNIFQWEVLGRGVAALRRGQAFALAFGAGPILAFLSSLGAQSILSLEYPWNYAALFGGTVPIMVLAAFLSTRFVIPPPDVEIQRQPFVAGVFGGLGEFFGHRLILIAAIAMILVASGYNILPNISLYTAEAIGEPAEKYVGYQNALRFGFKIIAGLFLGWLLGKSNPKTGLLMTAGFALSSVLWAWLAPRASLSIGELTIPIFLLSFGLMGAGELFGVYYPNYIFSCSAKSQMRRNMAFSSMLNMPSGFAALLFGVIADTAVDTHTLAASGARLVAGAGSALGTGPIGALGEFLGRSRKFGFQMSFVAATAILVLTLIIVLTLLPTRPRPKKEDTDAQ